MSKFTEYIGSQFGNPHGFVGKICCILMNIINNVMYKNTVAMLKLKNGDLPYSDNMFSGVSSINTIYFWSDTVKGLSEIRRVLKPGKSFYNVVYTKEWLDKLSYTKKGFKKFELEELVELGAKAGFKKIEVKDIVKGKSLVVIYTKSC